MPFLQTNRMFLHASGPSLFCAGCGDKVNVNELGHLSCWVLVHTPSHFLLWLGLHPLCTQCPNKVWIQYLNVSWSLPVSQAMNILRVHPIIQVAMNIAWVVCTNLQLQNEFHFNLTFMLHCNLEWTTAVAIVTEGGHHLDLMNTPGPPPHTHIFWNTEFILRIPKENSNDLCIWKSCIGQSRAHLAVSTE